MPGNPAERGTQMQVLVMVNVLTFLVGALLVFVLATPTGRRRVGNAKRGSTSHVDS
jgi:hypothetical protein